MIPVTSQEQWFGFHEAVALVRELRKFSDAKSKATVKRAIDSGDVGHSLTEQYIVKEDKRAHQELSESVQRDVARNFKNERERARHLAFARTARSLREGSAATAANGQRHRLARVLLSAHVRRYSHQPKGPLELARTKIAAG